MKIIPTLLVFFAVFINSIESSRRQGNEWIPPSPESVEGFNVHEITGLLNDLGSPVRSYANDFGNHTSVHRTPAEHIHQDDHFLPGSHLLSSQSKVGPDSDNNISIHRFGSPSSPGRQSPDMTLPLERPHPPTGSATRVEPPSRGRSKSPTLRKTFPSLLGFRFEDLSSIRMTPLNNRIRIFGIERYVFPSDKPIRLRTRYRVLIRMPAEEQLVLSTANRDVYAIFEKKTLSRNTILRAIFTPVFGMPGRVKINMDSGVIEELTTGEIADCPVSNKEPLTKMYRIFRA